MTSDEQILKEADYYINNNVTVEQASKDLGVSKRTLQLHLKKLESICSDKFKLVQEVKTKREYDGKIKGGTLGKRTAGWTMEEAKDITNQMIEKDLTYREAEKQLGIPHSTIHSMVKQADKTPETDSLLYALALAHQRGMSIDEFVKTYYGEHVEPDKLAKALKNQEISSKTRK